MSFLLSGRTFPIEDRENIFFNGNPDCLTQQWSVIFGGVKFEDILPTGPYPFGRHGDEAENKFLQPEAFVEPGNFFGKGGDDKLIEVGVDGRHDHEGRVLMEE